MSPNQPQPNKRIWLVAAVSALLLIVGGVALSAFLSSRPDSIPAQEKQDDDDDKDDKKDSKQDDSQKEDKD